MRHADGTVSVVRNVVMSVRSLLFLVTLYVSLLVWMIFGLPVLILPRGVMVRFARLWSLHFLWLCRVIGGLKVEIRGREHIPSGPLLIASKHQSMWETFALLSLFSDPCFILKRELAFIPFFGWYLFKLRNVPIDRKSGSRALVKIIRAAHKEIRVGHGRQILFFPEGTRRPPGAPPEYRHGIAQVYSGLDVPCLPIGLNAGLYWPRRSLKLRQGTIILEILPPIPPGLDRAVFFARMQDEIEHASDRLIAEGRIALGETIPSR
jgi:1-acyl-sn-glycerol-3-phosphate acyltransferase